MYCGSSTRAGRGVTAAAPWRRGRRAVDTRLTARDSRPRASSPARPRRRSDAASALALKCLGAPEGATICRLPQLVVGRLQACTLSAVSLCPDGLPLSALSARASPASVPSDGSRNRLHGA